MLVGFKELEAKHEIRLAQPLRVESTIGTTRTSLESPDRVQNRYTPGYRPEDTFACCRRPKIDPPTAIVPIQI